MAEYTDTFLEKLIINHLTTAEYNSLTVKDPNQIYILTDAKAPTGNISDSNYVEKYGIKADYSNTYGILDCPNGLIDTAFTSKEIEIQPGIVLKAAGSSMRTMIASKMKYTIQEEGDITLFFTRTESESGTVQVGFLEAGDVFYQTEEPSNGSASYLAWWNPEEGLWKFKSDDTGNVWRSAVATPIANITVNDSNTGIKGIDYVGYRLIDDDNPAQLSDIENIQGHIQTINNNISNLETSISFLANSADVYTKDQIDSKLLTSIIELTSGMEVEQDKVYKAEITGDYSITLPTVTDKTHAHTILLYIKTGDTVGSIDYGTTNSYDTLPQLEANSFYDIVYVYNPVLDGWVCSVRSLVGDGE